MLNDFTGDPNVQSAALRRSGEQANFDA